MPASLSFPRSALACAALAALGAFGALGAFSSALAQQPAPAAGASTVKEAASLPEVAVTAKGYAAATVETPASVEVLTADDIARKGATSLGQAFVGEPGLSATSDGAQNMNPVVRGLKKESLVLMVDGMRVNSAQPYGAVGSFVSLGLADRVEVLKGPASVLYGAGALGGAVNVLLPQARFDAGVSGRLGLRAATGDSSFGGAGVVNWSGGDHALMVGAAGADFGNYRAGGERIDRTGYDTGALIGQYRYRIDGAQQIRFSVQRENVSNVWYPGSTQANANAQIGSTIIHSPKQSRELMEVGYSHKGRGPVNFDVRLYRQAIDRQMYAWANGPLQRETTMTDVSFDTTGLDARADWALNDQHLISFGFNGWRMSASPDRRMFNNGNYVQNNPFADGRVQAAGLYVQDDMRFGKLGVVAGLRYDRVSGDAASINNGAVTTGLERSDGAVSGSLGAMYEVSPLLRPYVSFSRGFRPGEMRERFESSPRGDGYMYIGNPQIKPEIGQQIELGVKGKTPELEWFAAAYRNRISNYITGRATGQTQNGLPVRQTINLGSVRISGLEVGARWQFVRDQWLNVGYSRIRGYNNDFNEALYQMPADEFTVSWDGRLGAGWRADARVRHVLKQNRVATVFSRGLENATPGFTTLDLGATWTRGPHQVRLAVLNLTNRKYHEHLAEGVSGFEMPAPGRSLAVSYRLQF
ncbi:TonB-dependent receptor [Ottowia thiooxydans]|uniref:TonB-dependent receptor n=1 Tax=Ottowia thiooxydans TaxID=219182 RepID=UPI0004085840|nr:TonB-dependent receptor [Ottowia thiooxydans]